MTYIHVPVASSQHARQLADELSTVVAAYRQRHPGTKDADVQEALRLVAQGSGGSGLVRLLLYLGMGLALLAGFIVFMLVRRG